MRMLQLKDFIFVWFKLDKSKPATLLPSGKNLIKITQQNLADISIKNKEENLKNFKGPEG